MIKSFVLILFLTVVFSCNRTGDKNFDVVIYGSTPAGIAAAVTAARNGKSSIILDPHKRLGGMPASGMSNLDFRTYESLGGFCKTFMDSATAYYRRIYGPGSQELKECWYGLNYEPKVALQIFEEMIAHYGIDILPESLLLEVNQDGDNIQSIQIQNLKNQKTDIIKGKIFIDATYEGDLMAMAGEEYVLGAESRDTYQESLAPETANQHVMAYNFRVMVTNSPDNRIPFHQPEGYDSKNFHYLIEGFKTGSFDKLTDVLQILTIPNHKANMNDRHNANIEGFMLYELSDAWPEASHAKRDSISKIARYKAESYFYLLSNDENVPKSVRDDMAQWGYPKDEFIDNNHFPPWLYVREGRRMLGQYVFTQHDAGKDSGSVRAPAHETAIAVGDFFFSSHGTHLNEQGNKMGHIGEPTLPYQIPYGVILPKKTQNLLVPVAISASRVGFSSIRMEPPWIALGEAAGAAAVESLEQNKAPEDIDIQKLQTRLHDAGAITFYTSDIKPGTTYFKAVQFLGNRGFFKYLYPDSLQVEPGAHITKYVVEAFTLHDVAPDRLLSEKLKQEWVTMAQNKFDLDGETITKLTQNSKNRGDFLLALYGVVINSKN
jgi:hypothetical protein